MARLSRDSNLETRTARARLKQRHEPYWRQIHPGLAIGYRKGKRGGVWVARCATESGYSHTRLGKADDHADPNGIDVLSYKEAHRKAIGSADQVAAQESQGIDADYTVADCMRDYLEWFKVNRKSHQDTRYAVKAHILPRFGRRKASELTTRQIRKWHEKLALRNEDLRKGKSTANRVLTVFKAALNRAYDDGHVGNPEVWKKVKPFRDVDAPRERFLTVAECKRLVNASDPDFRPLVRAALVTGCRYGELCALVCRNYDPDSATVYVADSKSGKPRHVPLTDEGVALFDELTAGKVADAEIFTRADSEPWSAGQQKRRMADACTRAKIEPGVGFHVLRHSYASVLVKRGVSLQIVATLLGHADTRTTEKHYAHLAPSHVADVLRANLPTFQRITSKVAPIDRVTK